MSADVDMSEVMALAAEFGEVAPRVKRISSQKMTEIAAQLRDAARANAPVDTGELRGSIRVIGGDDYRIVRADARHGFFVEFGTADTPPQPFMWPAASAAAEAMTEAFEALSDPFGNLP